MFSCSLPFYKDPSNFTEIYTNNKEGTVYVENENVLYNIIRLKKKIFQPSILEAFSIAMSKAIRILTFECEYVIPISSWTIIPDPICPLFITCTNLNRKEGVYLPFTKDICSNNIREFRIRNIFFELVSVLKRMNTTYGIEHGDLTIDKLLSLSRDPYITGFGINLIRPFIKEEDPKTDIQSLVAIMKYICEKRNIQFARFIQKEDISNYEELSSALSSLFHFSRRYRIELTPPQLVSGLTNCLVRNFASSVNKFTLNSLSPIRYKLVCSVNEYILSRFFKYHFYILLNESKILRGPKTTIKDQLKVVLGCYKNKNLTENFETLAQIGTLESITICGTFMFILGQKNYQKVLTAAAENGSDEAIIDLGISLLFDIVSSGTNDTDKRQRGFQFLEKAKENGSEHANKMAIYFDKFLKIIFDE
ncbi:hypothetical protein GPJ56_002300 [Histomonas meleagridis]|uniref:uncharacterized protein n=1 Tax=Histomonas meleagridis TaxID=135588 RepID=UPI003559A2E5|nr:hypothetical protein GPJ56_002300 [Histomonas meleagridis]KAH0804561.1 hypothetical protein GO595_003391 [Histomonas meleagridis]